jgi:hypothetical protein
LKISKKGIWRPTKSQERKPKQSKNTVERMKRINNSFNSILSTQQWPIITGIRTKNPEPYNAQGQENDEILLDIHNTGDGFEFSGKLVEAFIEGLKNIKAENTNGQ